MRVSSVYLIVFVKTAYERFFSYSIANIKSALNKQADWL